MKEEKVSLSENPTGDSSGEENGAETNCFIATATFGTPMAKEVRTLCKFRDKYLLTSAAGRIFVNLYYRLSPPIAEFIKDKPLLKTLIRIHLKLLLK